MDETEEQQEAGPLQLDRLMVCPQCDALYRIAAPGHGELAVCGRCHTVIAAPRRKAGAQIIALAVATLILIGGAAVFPFLRIEVAGLSNSTSLVDAALAFSEGRLIVLVAATLALILAIPALRTGLLIYVLLPVVLDRPPARGARAAFRWAERLRPWSMAEVFALGCAVSLIKITDLARVEFGPAFWMFAVLTLLVVIQQRFMCSWSVWNSLNSPQTR